MKNKENLEIDIQGHRGCRGLMPENSIPAFLLALELGVNTLELDVVVSKDKQVIVSHEPYFSHEISLDTRGREISKEDEKSFNLYELTAEEIQQYDCGSKTHPRFPQQVKTKVYKPTLTEVFERVEPLIRDYGLNDLAYNIEIKRTPEGDGIFHPEVKEFVELVLQNIQSRELKDRVIIQSFDAQTLQIVRQLDPTIRLAWLVDNEFGLQKNLDLLGFVPHIYSPNYRLVDQDLVSDAHKQNMKVIPWTVNELNHISQMVSLGVDGIISDYPDRVKSALSTRS